MTTKEEPLIKILTLRKKDFEQIEEEGSAMDPIRWKILGWVSPAWTLLQECNSGRLVKGRIFNWAAAAQQERDGEYDRSKIKEEIEDFKDSYPQLFLRYSLLLSSDGAGAFGFRPRFLVCEGVYKLVLLMIKWIWTNLIIGLCITQGEESDWSGL